VAEQVLREKPAYYPALRYAAASNVLREAEQAIAHLRQIDPERRVSDLQEFAPGLPE
jgi:hypothetical protein